MLHPLCSLWRHNCRVTFYESGSQARFAAPDRLHQQSMAGAPRTFTSNDDAYHYLRHWMGEPAARAELGWLLQRSGPSLSTARAGDDGWLHALAARIVGGEVLVMEELNRQAMPGRLVAAGGGAAAAASLAALPSLASQPKVPVVVPILPVLEELRIEGAEVLPELDQSLAEVELSIARFSGASLSLDPAPDKVAQIAAAMKAAADEAQATLSSS
ncbi:hypothetical protein HF313_19620 [Massilia atriviolacea]|uniref:Uncharacterized protein n=1 Tax=Massilia atriviolacea TaxID=2495579 RepID=A0A430HSG6_9BURK|nr:hypothetical protein [Massilia atriviolacea]RSZ60488.1 hypothetical protein EJB06_05080 [Massilia atriviolacea]